MLQQIILSIGNFPTLLQESGKWGSEFSHDKEENFTTSDIKESDGLITQTINKTQEAQTVSREEHNTVKVKGWHSLECIC